jgi:hypothetical protein
LNKYWTNVLLENNGSKSNPESQSSLDAIFEEEIIGDEEYENYSTQEANLK